ncbi:MAG: BamA/TamA family outer membrane protein [Nitrospirota bacterium]
MHRTAWGRAVLATLVCLWAQAAAASPALDVRYDLDVRFDPTDQTLAGEVRVTIMNHTAESLRDIPFVLYPNRYREPDPEVDRVALERIYPRRFNPGAIAVVSIESADHGAVDLTVEDPVHGPPRTIARATLERPVPPEGSVELRMSFVTFIPEKFGVFGHFHGVTALTGGWHPYVAPWRNGRWALDDAPDPAAVTARILAPRSVTIVGADMTDPEPDAPIRRWHVHAPRAAGIPLALSSRYHVRTEHDGSVRIHYAFLPDDRPYVPLIMATFRSGLAFFRREYGEVAGAEVIAAETHLHQQLVSPDPRVIFVATRAFKVFAPLKKYHEAELVKGLLFALWRSRLPDEEVWVIEGLADASTQRYLRERYRKPPSLVRLLKPVAFIPIVDQILYSNRLPLRQVYFKEATPVFPREELALFNNQRPDGSTVFFKLTGLIGADAVNAVLERYTALVLHGETASFRAVVETETGRDLEWFYRQWLQTNPKTDFAVTSVRRARMADGYHTTVDLTKTGTGIEPVSVTLHQRRGPPLTTTWLSYDANFQETFVTPSPVTAVELDPDHKTSDPDRFNDRTPAAIKFIWEKLPGISYDFQTKNLSYDVSAYFQRRYDEHNILRLQYSNNETETGGSVAAIHDYERSLFAYSTRQSVGIGLSTTRRAEPLRPGGSSDAVTSAELSHVMSNATTSLVYPDEIQQLIFGAIPYSTVGTTLATQLSGNRHPSAVRVQLKMRHQWGLATLHEIAVRAALGQSIGNFAEARQFELGGSSGMRGYSPGSLFGESLALASLEYRRPVARELDANIWGVSLLRRLQAVVFADVGTVSSYRQLRSDIGGGVRLTHEILGLYPIVTRLDVAYPLNVEESLQADERSLHFYLTAGQPF